MQVIYEDGKDCPWNVHYVTHTRLYKKNIEKENNLNKELKLPIQNI
jgi:hypothetical protein